MVFINPGTVDLHVKEHVAELLREAERERLASAVNRAEQPLRVRVAQRLRAAASGSNAMLCFFDEMVLHRSEYR